jgi:hypothetical protein
MSSDFAKKSDLFSGQPPKNDPPGAPPKGHILKTGYKTEVAPAWPSGLAQRWTKALRSARPQTGQAGADGCEHNPRGRPERTRTPPTSTHPRAPAPSTKPKPLPLGPIRKARTNHRAREEQQSEQAKHKQPYPFMAPVLQLTTKIGHCD